MNETERMMIEKERQALDLEQQKINQGQPGMEMQAMQLREQQRSWVHDQINLGEELDLIEHLLRSEILKEFYDDQGNVAGTKWVKPEKKEYVILSEYGVHMFMNTICFYLNKNTLLSNYDEETINKKMEDFSVSLADVVFMESESIFQTPTFEECKNIFKERIQRKVDLRRFAYETIGRTDIDEQKIKAEFIKDIEDKIETEFQKIKEQLMKNKYKRFELLIREIQDAVHSTYLRALYGAERRTLRQHSHFNESLGSSQIPQRNKPPMSPMGLFRRR